MRLVPIGGSDRSWNALKSHWKSDAESAGEDFSTWLNGVFAALDTVANQEPAKSGLYCFYDESNPRAFCEIKRLLISRFPTPVVRARFVTVSPLYDAGLIDLNGYAQLLVSLFSAVVWLSRTTLGSQIIRFNLRSPADAQYFTALQIVAPLSPFAKFTIKGAWIECVLKNVAS